MRCFWRCVMLNDGSTRLVPVSATNYLGHLHRHAPAESFESAMRLPRVQVNSTSLPPALVSRLYDERPTLVKRGCVAFGSRRYATMLPNKRYVLIEQLNFGVRHTRHPYKADRA
jgi:hypothetical protein